MDWAYRDLMETYLGFVEEIANNHNKSMNMIYKL